MIRNVRRAQIAVFLGWLFLAGPAMAQVKDNAMFFSAQAVSQADQAIRQIKQGWNKDVKVETFSSAPADKIEGLDAKGRKKFFVAWADDRAKTLAVKGVYIHIVKKPGHLEVVVDDATKAKAIPVADRNAVSDLLLENFKKKDYDKGLSGAVALIRGRLEKNLGPPVPPPALVDEGQFFSPEARKKALADIQELKKRFQKNLVVETFKTPPPDIRQQLEGQDAEGKNKVWAEWLRQRSAARGGDGILVLISKEPPHVQIGASDVTYKKEFLPKDRDELTKRLLAAFKDKKYDQALAGALIFVYDRMDRNTSKPLPAPVVGSILDRAGYFTASKREEAAKRIKDLQDKQGMDLSIETFPGIYAGAVKKFANLPKEAKEKRADFFRAWAKERAQKAGAKGVWVLICKEPPFIQVSLGAGADKAGKFNAADRDVLRGYIRKGFEGKQADRDRVLVGAPAFVAETMRALQVKDDAGYFKNPETLAAANQKIKALRRRFKKDVLIETMVLPADKKEAYEKLEDKRAKDQFFADLLQERAKAAGAGGVHVLICKDPKHIQVGVAEDTIKKFPASERDLLRDLLVKYFKFEGADEALNEAVAFIYGTLPALPIKDEGGFFSAAALDQANAGIRDIRRRFARDILIETFKDVPPERAKGVNLDDPVSRRKFFAAWAADRQKSAKLDAISLLVCKKPMSLQVAVGPKTKAKFSDADRDKLVGILIGKFKANDYDAGLAEGLTFISAALKATQFLKAKGEATGHTGTGSDFGKQVAVAGPTNGKKDKSKNKNTAVAQGNGSVPKEKPKQSGVKDFMEREVGGFKMEWLIWGILGLLALWIFIGVLRALFARKPTYYPPPQQSAGYAGSRAPMQGQQPGYGGHPQGAPGPYYGGAPAGGGGGGGGGGGFFSGLLGGMFGAAAGSWLYSRFAGHSGTTSFGGAASAGHSGSTSPQVTGSPGTQGTGYSSSGGDFGETPEKTPGYSSSGGDFGEATPERQQGYSSSGGDFGQQEETTGAGSSGGDFGEQEESTASSGGDFGSEQSEPVDTGGGGDFGSGDSGGADTGGGGDFGGNVDTGGGGGDFGSGDSGGGGDTGGGGDFGGGGGTDFGGGGGGGDFGGGGGGDIGSGGGGDFGGGGGDSG